MPGITTSLNTTSNALARASFERFLARGGEGHRMAELAERASRRNGRPPHCPQTTRISARGCSAISGCSPASFSTIVLWLHGSRRLSVVPSPGTLSTTTSPPDCVAKP